MKVIYNYDYHNYFDNFLNFATSHIPWRLVLSKISLTIPKLIFRERTRIKENQFCTVTDTLKVILNQPKYVLAPEFMSQPDFAFEQESQLES